jgi:RNA polymerase sigma factor (sigma-70 family)
LLTLPLPQPEKWAHALRVSEQDAEDLIQDAVLALLEKPNERPRSPRGWLFGAARLGRRRLLRARARAAKYEPQVEAYLRDLGGPFPAPDEELDCRERLLAVFWLLDHVKPGRRAVAEHHLLGESSEEDIAAELGLVLGTVKSQWRRAKADMRAGLDREMAKNGDKAWLAGLFALVAALWLWVSRHVRRRPGRLLACAALSLAVSTDGASSAESVSRTDDATSSLRISLPSIAVFLPAWAEREAGAEGSAINLEHREELVRNPRIGLAIKAETRAKTTTSHQGDPLAKVREAMRRGDLEEAAMALRAYETNHPDPNANSLHRALRIALAERMHARQ